MRPLFAPLLVSAALSLTACASMPSSAGLRGDQPPTAPEHHLTAYGEFLAGATASREGREGEASVYFERGAALSPEPALLNQQAFTAALIAGEVPRAAKLAPLVDSAPAPIQGLGRLTRAVDALADHRPRDALTLITGVAVPPPHRIGALLLTPWIAAEAGDWKTALTLPDANGDHLIDSIAKLNQALLLEIHGDKTSADALYRKLLAEGDDSGVIADAYGRFLERGGRRADALAIYNAGLKGDPNNAALRQAHDRVVSGASALPAPSLAEGAAQALMEPAEIYLSEKQVELGLIYLRLTLRLDPKRDEAWVMVGDILAAANHTDGAREAYARVAPGSAEFVNARARMIATYDQASDNATALDLAQDTLKAAPDDQDAQILVADQLRANDQFAASAAILDKVIATQGDKADWRLYYMRGAALAQADQWPAAEKDLLRALAMQPDQPEVLNFLGFSWIDRGVRLSEAKAMVEKAVAASPDSGAMVDSLGWAYYKLGDYPKAVQQLEHAVELDGGDPEINDHLGDAYWAVGRKLEARFQWDAVLGFAPSAKLRAQVEDKLKTRFGVHGGAAIVAGAKVAAR